jgi:hypothetical protein
MASTLTSPWSPPLRLTADLLDVERRVSAEGTFKAFPNRKEHVLLHCQGERLAAEFSATRLPQQSDAASSRNPFGVARLP